MLYEMPALQQAYAAQTGVRLSFVGVLHDKSFFLNVFADFSDVVQVKKSRFCPAVGGVSLATSPIVGYL